MLTIYRTDDPSKTREVNELSWKRWPKAKGLDPNKYRSDGRKIWTTEEAELPKPTVKNVVVPEEVRRVKGGKQAVGPDGLPNTQA